MMKKYRHYKGGLYEIICTANLESDRSVQMMVYKSEDGTVWTRPASEFFEQVNDKGQKIPRFQLIEYTAGIQ
jgi:hypothetical protein